MITGIYDLTVYYCEPDGTVYSITLCTNCKQTTLKYINASNICPQRCCNCKQPFTGYYALVDEPVLACLPFVQQGQLPDTARPPFVDPRQMRDA